MQHVAIADQIDEMHDPQTFITKYVWSQDHKVIAIQYGSTAIVVGLVALVLSGLMRLQLGFPDTFDFIDPSAYLQFVTMHGMIMVIYLLTALLLGGFGNYLIPLMVGARDMVFPYMNMLSFWFYLLSVIVLLASFFVPGGPTGAGWTLYPPQAILQGTPGYDWGIILMLASLAIFIIAFTMGGLNYVTTVLQARTTGMTLMRMPLTIWGIFTATVLGLLAFPALLVSAIMMMLDKVIGTSFFMPALVSLGETLDYTGGSPVLFQHLFWFFGACVAGRNAGLHRRQPGVVSTPVLVFRTPGGLYRGPTGIRYGLRCSRDPCAQEYFRLPHDGLGHCRYWWPELCCLGSPHVCQRHASGIWLLLRDDHAHHCDTHCHQGL